MSSAEKRARSLARLVRLAGDRAGALRSAPRFVYIGGDGVGNLGDDTMAEAARRVLAPAQLLPLAAEERERRLRRLGLSGPAFFHGAILGGGTLVNPLWHRPVLQALADGLPLWTLGTGVGSCGFAQPEGIAFEDWQPQLRRFRALGVRGPRSQARLRELGLDAAEVLGDLALALTPETRPKEVAPTRFLLNVAGDPGDPETARGLAALEEAARSLVERSWQPVAVALHWDDEAPLKLLLGRLGRAGNPVHRPTTPEAFFALAAPCSLSLSVRLHGAVLGCCLGIPPLLLAYREKGLDFLESMDLGSWALRPDSDAATARKLLSRLEAERFELRDTIHRRALDWRRRLEAYGREILRATISATRPGPMEDP